ncbi:MarR family winged helix-turn-helix transcriptional regulator [Corynebacterium anserum]|uniref:MarR family transcriptional regulator n=1 Tax=Corynebacterium anserum TaxID=2684406 RepID=A0A7G7YQL8_9CORY|nr:MarR family winged helix-turn-helix transcriptional regulator [Corynebacterium anserum]MBC2682483.1 MarR family transcriptional regulator [Corynebacterium anserum]QNH96788.1 MarR family transcriptional regulator [Corynebacterium anserum]
MTITPISRTQSGQPWLSDKEQALWREWLLVTRRMESVLAKELLSQSSISYADYAVLVHLSESAEGRYRIAALAESLDWDRSRLSHQITRMAKRGLVRRETCSNDGRGAYVAIEEHGRKIIAEASPGHVAGVRRHMFELIDEDEQETLLHILKKLAVQFTDSQD